MTPEQQREKWLKRRALCKRSGRCKESPNGYEACIFLGRTTVFNGFSEQQARLERHLHDCKDEMCHKINRI